MVAQFSAWSVFFLLCIGCSSAAIPPSATPTADPVQAETAEQLFKKGRESAERGDTVRAEQYIELALDKGYDRKRALPVLLSVCLSSGRLRSALNYAEPELRERPDDLELRYLVAAIHLGLGQRDEARVELEQVLRIDPHDPATLYLLGVMESEEFGDVSAARKHFGDYLGFAPNGKHAAEVRDRLGDLDVRHAAGLDVEPAQITEKRMPRYEPALPGPEALPSPAVETIRPNDDESGWR